MIKNLSFRKSIACALIALMANPLAITAAYGRDSDIFLSVTTAAQTGEPNIVLLLDTSDSMNIPEPWREYPLPNPTGGVNHPDNINAYDSHTEYLWNDLNIIVDANAGTGSEITTENISRISTGVPGSAAFSPYGFWAGNTLADRRALWQAARTHAKANEGTDPGPRSTWRNYSDASWLYWLPAGSLETDPRLRSATLSAFSGGVRIIGSATPRGGITYTTASDFRGFNKCASSLTHLTPSTVFAPTTVPLNTGKYLDKQWARWERYRGLNGINISAAPAGLSEYPGDSTGFTSNIGTHAKAYFDASVAPPNNAKRDDQTNGAPYGNWGQPIRVSDGSSFAGWRQLRADHGGYRFKTNVGSTAAATLTQLRLVYGYALRSDNVGANEYYSAWAGNRDAGGVAFGNSVGTRGYYDATQSPCNSVTGPNVAGCAPVLTGGTANITVTKTRACTYTASLSELDAGGTNRLRGGSCTASGTIVVSGDTNGAAFPNDTDVADPGNCSATTVKNNSFIDNFYDLNAWSGRLSVGVASCAWTGRQQVYVEGTGVYFYGGTCTENGSTASCSTAGATTRTINGTSQPLVTGPYANPTTAAQAAAGCGNAITAGTYYHGGTCNGRKWTAPPRTNTGSAAAPANSNISGVTASVTIRGTAYTNVLLNNATGGCNANGQTDRTCLTQYGIQCDHPNTGLACPATANSAVGGGSAATTTYRQYWYKAASEDRFNHDCREDDATAGNPASSYMREADRTFGTAWNTGTSSASMTHAYTTSAGQRISSDSSIRTDTYSVNYLNWKFGAKTAAGNPIGRKTRLQIAKDALTILVQNTDGVRFGLMVFNKTAGCTSTSAVASVGTNVLTVSDNPGFSVSNNVRTTLVGLPGGADLLNSISAITVNASDTTLTLSTVTNPPYATTGSVTAAGNVVTVASTANFNIGQTVRVVGAGQATTGSITAASNLVLVADATNLNVGDKVKVVGAGAAGVDLLSTITAVGSGPASITLATAASTTVTDAVVVADLISDVTAIDAGPSLTLTNPAGATVAGAAVQPAFVSVTVSANPCSGTSSNEGANVASRVRRMGSNSGDPDYANRATLKSAIDAVTAAARTPLTESLYEAYRYFSGRTPRFGTLTTTAASGGGFVTAGRDTSAVCTAGGTVDCPTVGVYRSPMLSNPTTTSIAGCQENYVVLITDGGPEDDWAANADVKRLRHPGLLGTVATRTSVDAFATDTPTDQFESGGVRYGPTDLAGTANDGGYIWLDELAYFMATADVSPGARNEVTDTSTDRISGRQSVTVYTIGFAGGNSPVLSNAGAGGSNYFVAENAAALSNQLESVITAIRDWTPTATGSTVPISALNRAENAAEIYLGFFQPHESTTWVGTVKKFALSIDAAKCGFVGICIIGQTELTKAAPNISPSWNIETVSEDPTTKVQEIIVDPLTSSLWGPTSLKDGSKPHEGGTGTQLITTSGYNPSTRNLYTFISGGASSTNLADPSNRFGEANAAVSKTRLGDVGMTDARRAELINYALGGDSGVAACTDSDPGTACTSWRAWAHADVQHSKPAVVQYDIVASPAVQTLYYLSNDGILHAVDTNTGQELWAFLIEEALPKISGLKLDAQAAQIDGGDGSISVHVEDTNGDGVILGGTEHVWLYFGLRRGGRTMYALDVTNRLAPQFKWKVTAESGSGQICSGAGACSGVAALNELGQTWSTPRVAKIRYLGLTTPALIFGGGYDPQEDGVPGATSSNTMGRAVYILNGDTGAVVNSFGSGQAGVMTGSMTFAVPSDPGVYNTDFDSQNYMDRIYVGDMGGNVWRFDIDNINPTLWSGKLLADLSDGSGQKRKIFFQPVVVKQVNPERFDAVYVGTGDREHPRLTSTSVPPTVADKMFMIMDRDVGLAMSGAAAASFAGGDFLVLDETATGGIDATLLGTKKGWYRSLQDGEKVINAATVFNQRLRFGTYAPLASANACTAPGVGRLNEINALNGALLPLNGTTALTAEDRYYAAFTTRGYISDSVAICIGGQCYLASTSDSRLFATPLPPMGAAGKIYWYMEPEQ